MSADTSRRLAAIVSIDIVGFSALTERDAPRAADAVARLRTQGAAIAEAHRGRIFNTAGDGLMLEFSSASEAFAAAVALCGAGLEPPLRAGVHLGEVIATPGGDLLGHGVNVAARLQAEASPGGVLVSQTAREIIKPDLASRLVARGRIRLAKMRETMAVFTLDAPARPLAAHEPVIAVLPFDSVAKDRATRALADAMTEEVLHLISRITGIKVIGSTSSFAFRGRNKSKAASALSASHLLTGSVQRIGDAVRVTAQLTDADQGYVLWSDRYDGDMRDPFALQEAIAQKTAQSLDLAFREIARERGATIDAALFGAYADARQSLRRGGATDINAAIETFERVVREAPRFVRAWAGLSTARLEAMRLARFDRVRLADEAREAAERALGLDPTIGEPYAVLASLETEFGRWAEREALLRKGVEAEPNNPLLHFRHGQFLVSTGQVAAGYAQQARAYELDPLEPMFAAFHGHNVWARGVKDEGRRILREAHDRYPDNVFVWYMRLTTASLEGDHATADALRLEAARLIPELLDSAVYRSGEMIQNMLRNPSLEALMKLTADMSEMAAADASAALDLAVALSVLGQSQPALLIFTRALDDVDLWRRAAPAAARPHIGYETALIFIDETLPLRRDPGFVDLCARLGLVRYWKQAGMWPDCVADATGAYDFVAACEAL